MKKLFLCFFICTAIFSEEMKTIVFKQDAEGFKEWLKSNPQIEIISITPVRVNQSLCFSIHYVEW
jgi:hypothetical protein